MQKNSEYLEKIISQVFKNTTSYIFIKDPNDDFRYIYWSNQLKKLTGYSEKDVLGKTDFEIFQNDKRASLRRQSDEMVMNTGIPAIINVSICGEDGLYRNLKYCKSILKTPEGKDLLFVIGDDITEIEKSNNRLAMLFNLERILPYTFDLVNNQLIFDNPLLYILNDPTDQIPKSSFQFDSLKNIVLPEYHSVIIEVLDNIRSCVINQFSIDIQIYQFNNQVRWKRISGIVSVRDDHGSPCVIEGVSVDIHDRKTLESDLIQEKQKVEKIKRESYEFIQALSTEFITPINVILKYSDESAHLSDFSEQIQLLKTIGKKSLFLSNLSESLMYNSDPFSDAFQVHKETFKIWGCFFELQNIQATEISNSKRIILENKPDQSVICAEKTKLIKVISILINWLVSNSSNSYLVFGYILKNNTLKVYFKDTGHSDFNDLIRRAEFSGSKLDLLFCKYQIEQMGGVSQFNSENTLGSEFTFSIPVEYIESEEVVEFSEKKYDMDQNKSEIKRTILIADDVEVNYMVLRSILEDNYRVIHAENGEVAIRMFKENNPDLILMDLKMPVIDGFEATRRIREYSKIVPIIAITAYPIHAITEQANKAGCNELLTKPVIVKQLQAIVNRYLE